MLFGCPEEWWHGHSWWCHSLSGVRIRHCLSCSRVSGVLNWCAYDKRYRKHTRYLQSLQYHGWYIMVLCAQILRSWLATFPGSRSKEEKKSLGLPCGLTEYLKWKLCFVKWQRTVCFIQRSENKLNPNRKHPKFEPAIMWLSPLCVYAWIL